MTKRKTSRKKNRSKSKLFGKPRSQVIKRPGALTRKAKSAGKSVSKFCSDLPESAATRTKRQCNLAKTFSKWRRKG